MSTRRSPFSPQRRSGSFLRGLRRMGRAQVVVTVLALLVVCSLIGAAVGSAVIDEVSRSDDDGETTSNIDADEVETSLRREVEENPDDAGDHAALASYLANTGRMAEAIRWYEQALELEPDNWETRLSFARSLDANGMRADAEIQFLRVVEGEPENPQAHYYLAELYQHWDPPRTEEAVEQYRKTIEVGPRTFVAEQAQEELAALGFATPQLVATPQP